MPPEPTEPIPDVHDALAAWHATHPDATFAELEAAVEEQLDHLRVQLLGERAAGVWVDEHPLCPECGATMTPQTTSTRRLLLRGDQPLDLDRRYVVCPRCGTGLFPPG